MKKKFISFPKGKIKILLYGCSFIILLGLIGYIVILFGGRLVVNKEDLVLDATTTIETADGKVIGELFNEKRSPIPIEQVPLHIQQAFIAIEDGRFNKHAGVDFKSVVRALYRDIIAFDKVEGASTITQQLAKNLFLYNDKTWMRKTKEVMAAIYLEREFSKEELLELYLNKIYFGHGVYGIEVASTMFFSKSVQELSIAEGALLAGIVKSPSGYSPINHPDQSLARRNIVLKAMGDAKMINKETQKKEQGKTLGLRVNKNERSRALASYVDLVTKEAVEKHQLSYQELKRGGYRIIVNVDETIQQIAYDQFQMNNHFPGNKEQAEGAFVLMDRENGRVLAAIGGRNYEIGDLNRVTVKRQPGSVMKPLAVYGPAMMQNRFMPYSLIRDEKVDYDGYIASNYDNRYDGMVSIYDAITQSKNAPAVWLLNEIGINYAKDYLNKMGINISDEGLAIALGGLSEGVTPLEMVKGYSAFANNGMTVEPKTINRMYNQNGDLIIQEKIVTSEVFSPQVAWNMTEILLSTVETGTAKEGFYRKALAGKTGSTEHPFAKGMTKDAWFVGYTPEYVSALWMGYDISDKDHYLTAGSSYPTQLTKKILTELDERKPSVATFTKPANVEEVPKPMVLPKVTSVEGKYVFGIFPSIKGKLTWQVNNDDDRIIYRIYHEKDGVDERIGEVVGETEFVLDDISLFMENYYYVVPYNPLTKIEGEPSSSIKLTFK